MEREHIDAHVDRLRAATKDPLVIEDVEGHRGMLYSLFHTPSGRKFLESKTLRAYLNTLENAFSKSSSTMQRNLIRAFDSLLDERVVAILSELPESHGVHRLISRAISRRHTNALSLAAAALLDFKHDLDEEGFYRAHPSTIQYLDYFHAMYPSIGRHKIGDAARTLLKLSTHSRLSPDGTVPLRVRLTDAMRRWAQAGIIRFRGYKTFADYRSILANVAEYRGYRGAQRDLFVRRFLERILDQDIADKIVFEVSRTNLQNMPPESVRNILKTVREFPELLHSVNVVRDFSYGDLYELSPIHRQAVSGLNEFFMHHVLGQVDAYKERLFRRWAAEASLHVFGKPLAKMDLSQRHAAERYLRDVWRAMNRSVRWEGNEYVFGKTHIDEMLRSLYTEISCFTPYKGSENVPEAMGIIFLPHVRERVGGGDHRHQPIVPFFATVKGRSSPKGRILVHFDYGNGRLIVGSYGGSVGPSSAENPILSFARQFNRELEAINRKHADALSEVFLTPRISKIREILLGDQSSEWETHVVHEGELIPFYGDYLDKSYRGDKVHSVLYGRRIDVN